jgi:hypothetical protein
MRWPVGECIGRFSRSKAEASGPHAIGYLFDFEQFGIDLVADALQVGQLVSKAFGAPEVARIIDGRFDPQGTLVSQYCLMRECLNSTCRPRVTP